jgi:dolichol-phosphate mannosyltransferase
MNANAPCDISVIIPVFNEEESIVDLVDEVTCILNNRPFSFEIIVIDDGSTDCTVATLERLENENSKLNLVSHKQNLGQSAGLASGFKKAQGTIIVTLDGDGQNDPADIPTLLEELGSEIDCVCGVRLRRQDSVVKRVSSRVANSFRNFVTGDQVTDTGCALRAIRHEALNELPVFNGMHRFLPSMLRFQGFHVVEIPVNHRPRLKGNSKYGVGNRLFRGLRDCFAMRWYKARVIQGRRLRII